VVALMKHFLAFSYNMHDSSVSVADERRVKLVLEAERFYRVKKKRCDHAEMEELIGVALRYLGLTIQQIEGVACTAYLNEHLAEGQRDIEWVERRPVTIAGKRFEATVVNHHLSHAAIVYGFPGARDVAIDVVDGGGDFGDTHRTYRCRDRQISLLPSAPIHQRFSSRFYDVISRHIYGRMMSEGKLMALAVLGEPHPSTVSWLRENVDKFHSRPTEESLKELETHFPVGKYAEDQRAFDLAAAAQRLFEDLRCESVAALPGDAPQVLLSGGGTLNILANSRVKHQIGSSRELLIPPCCDDTGQSLGALLYYCHEQAGCPVTVDMPFVGFSDSQADTPLRAEDVTDQLVDQLCRNHVVFLHQGQSEIGPRALGHRSILALPTQRNHDLINHVIKGREFYRPVAPLVPLEVAPDWFDWQGESRFMLFAAPARAQTWAHAAGVCHYDGTARLQTVAAPEQPFLHRLLQRVGEATGCPILINTSLNPRGLPISSRYSETVEFRQTYPQLPITVFPQRNAG
jgi:carbamoyltransferase